MTSGTIINKRIPDKWRDYESCGVPIRDERIIAFKTPLSRRYDSESEFDNGVKECERFTPLDLLYHLRRTGLRLGMVVDFTNTWRYYNGMEFTNKGIRYHKIKCVGKEIPDEQVVQEFKEEVCMFLRNDTTDSLVGVHCTHGLNRAGYVVCRYLIECKGYNPEQAIEAFNRARGYQMERENYLEDLRLRKPKFENMALHVNRPHHNRIPASPPRRPRHYNTYTESLSYDRTRCARSYRSERIDQFGFESEHNSYRAFSRRWTDQRDHNLRNRPLRERGGDDDYANYDNNYHNLRNYYDRGGSYCDQRFHRSYRDDHVARHTSSFRDRSTPYSKRRFR